MPKQLDFHSLEDHLKRRLQFLLSEAEKSSLRDQVIVYTMRVLSNWATVGRDASSSKLKRKNCRVSRGAFELLSKTSTFKEWENATTNEHPLPLKTLWIQICSKAQDLTEEDLWDTFQEFQMVTVLCTEDAKLRAAGLQSVGLPIERYETAGIEILELQDPPDRIWIKERDARN